MTWQLAKIILGIAKNHSLPESSSNALTILDLKTETPLALSQLHFFLSAALLVKIHFFTSFLQMQFATADESCQCDKKTSKERRI